MKHIWAVAESLTGEYRGDWMPFAFFADAEGAEAYRAGLVASYRTAKDTTRVIRIKLNQTRSK